MDGDGDGDRDLGELFAVVGRRLIEAERPVLDRHELTMWEYIVLTRLGEGPAPNQTALARSIRHDKTRLIAVLDGLAAAELIVRAPEPSDRRAHVVAITASGRARLAAARADIRRMEAEFLGRLGPEERRRLRQQLTALAGPR